MVDTLLDVVEVESAALVVAAATTKAGGASSAAASVAASGVVPSVSEAATTWTWAAVAAVKIAKGRVKWPYSPLALPPLKATEAGRDLAGPPLK